MQEFSKCRKIDSLCYFQFSGIVVTEKGHLYKCEEKPEMLISKAAPFLVLTSLVAILVPQRGTPTWRTHTVSCNFLKIVFSITFFLNSNVDPEIVDGVRFYLPFDSFVSECCSSKQTHFIIMIKTAAKE